MRADEHPAKIRALIVDDEPLARSNLAVLLRMDPEIGAVSECGSGAEALGEIRVAKPDLLFLDVQMPECDGFDVLEMLGKDLPSAIVFVTAYDQYALRAFEAGALDYLLKPFDNARFELALGRAKQRIRMGVNQPKKLERFRRLTQITHLRSSSICGAAAISSAVLSTTQLRDEHSIAAGLWLPEYSGPDSPHSYDLSQLGG